MTLGTRTLILVTGLLVAAVLVTTATLAVSTRRSLLDQEQADGLLIAQLLARSAEFADRVPADVERALGQQMVAEAAIAAHLVAIGEAAGLTPDQINAHLQAITRTSPIDEFWITDEKGHAYLRSEPNIDFSFDPDPQKQPQAHVFWRLLTGDRAPVVQEARRREVDDQVFKYAAVAGVDKPRIVQVGYNARFLDELRQEVGLPRLIQDLVARRAVMAVRVVDSNLVTLAYSAAPGSDVAMDVARHAADLRQVAAEGSVLSALEGDVLLVLAPIRGAGDKPIGATLVELPTRHVQAAIRQEAELAALVVVLVLAAGLLASVVLARRITHPVAQVVAAAAAVEEQHFDPASLDHAAARADELGQLARVFQRMAREVAAREARLQQQVRRLTIEIDEAKKAREVAAITQTDYFKDLQQKARAMRRARAAAPG